MTEASKVKIQCKGVKAVAIPVTDEARAKQFYGETLGLPAADADSPSSAYSLGESWLLLKPDWYAAPSAEPSPRITIEVDDAKGTEQALKDAGVNISDEVVQDGKGYVGSFLDSEGNKIWYCSNA